MKASDLKVYQDALVSAIEDMTVIYKAEIINSGLVSKNSFTFDPDATAGIASIVGFSGKVKGRNLLWIPSSLAILITEQVVGDTVSEYHDEMVLFTVNEINNVVSGAAITELNNLFQLSLRLSPPSIFAGGSFEIITPKSKSYEVEVNIKSDYYKKALSKGPQDHIVMNVAIEGSLDDEK